MPATSPAVLWGGRILSILPCLVLLSSAAAKFAQPAGVVEGMGRMGIPLSLLIPLGVLEAAITLLYLFPRTAVLGAILLTGYLGGAVLTHLRIGDPFIMPVVIGIMLWGGLYLRDVRIQALIPLRREP